MSIESSNVNKEVVSLEGIVKSDLSVEQIVYFPEKGVKPQLREGCLRAL